MEVFDTPDSISAFAMLATRGALKLEIKGLKRRGKSAAEVARSWLKDAGLPAPHDKSELLAAYEGYLRSRGILHDPNKREPNIEVDICQTCGAGSDEEANEACPECVSKAGR